ncbi:MAG TPA: hypothetical protein PK324_18055, partial [Nocardioides sp.]|nr:hypothetical protein [Nocardioides sp.]
VSDWSSDVCASDLELVLPAPAAHATDWVLFGTLPSGSTAVAVNSSGTVVGTRSGMPFRWTSDAMVPLGGSGGAGCMSVTVTGISDVGVALGHEACGTYPNHQWRLLAWGPSSTVASAPLAGDYTVAAVAPDGSFVGTDGVGTNNGSPASVMDNKVITGRADLTAGGTVIVGATHAGNGSGIDISPDGTILWGQVVSADYFVPLSYFRDGGPAGPKFQRATETYEQVFGLLPDERVLARQAVRSSTSGDPATDYSSQELIAFDGNSPTTVNRAGGGLSAVINQRFVPGGNDKLLYGVATGSSVPPGQDVIVSWASPSAPPQALPIYHNTSESVRPVAASDDGAWLVLSNGEVWRDLDNRVAAGKTQCVQLGGSKTCVVRAQASARLKALANQEAARYNQQAVIAERVLEELAVIDGGKKHNGKLDPQVEAAMAQVLVRLEHAREAAAYWGTVAQDPPDRHWRTTASMPKVDASKVPGRGAQRAYLTAQLRAVAAMSCATDAINRGATALDKKKPKIAIAQYRAGAKCARKAASYTKQAAHKAGKAARISSKLSKRLDKVELERAKGSKIRHRIDRAVDVLAASISMSRAERKSLKAALRPGSDVLPVVPDLAALLDTTRTDAAQLKQAAVIMKQAVTKKKKGK